MSANSNDSLTELPYFWSTAFVWTSYVNLPWSLTDWMYFSEFKSTEQRAPFSKEVVVAPSSGLGGNSNGNKKIIMKYELSSVYQPQCNFLMETWSSIVLH